MIDYLEKRTWAEVSLKNIKDNYKSIKEHIPNGCKFLGVVKADAYGHGAYEVSKTLEEVGADYLAVSCLDEAIELREKGIGMPILILGHTPHRYVKELIEYDLTQTIANLAKAKEYSLEAKKLNKTLKVHIKVDTGMSRLGLLIEGDYFETGIKNIEESCKLENIFAEGIYTHFAVSDEEGLENKEYTYKQFNLFTKTIEELNKKGVSFNIRHCANSGAVVNYPEMCLDMVRPGLLLYGYGDDGKLNLKPCMSLKTRITTIKYFNEGTSISYGRHFTTSKKTKVGVLGIGYADGLNRCLSNNVEFYLDGNYIAQRGNICMDMCMVDLTNTPNSDIDDEVEIFGKHVDINVLANKANTIAYELLCAVSKRVPRVYKDEI